LYLVDDCPLAKLTHAELTHPSRWQLNVDSLVLNAARLQKLPQTTPSPAAPRTLAQWQSMLPYTWVTIDKLTVTPWQQWEGKIALALTPARQQLRYEGDRVTVQAQLDGQALKVEQFAA